MSADLISLPIFQEAPIELRMPLAERCALRRYQNKAVIYEQGAHAAAAYGVVSGAVRLETRTAEGSVALTAIVPPNLWVGEVPLCVRRPRHSTAIASGPTTLVELPEQAFEELLDAYPQMGRLVLRWVALKEMVMRAYAAEAATLPLEQRLARRLLPLSRMWGQWQDDGGLRIELDLTQEDLGQMLGATRQRINQIMGDWERRGILATRYRRVVLYDIAALEAQSGPLAQAVRDLFDASKNPGAERWA